MRIVCLATLSFLLCSFRATGEERVGVRSAVGKGLRILQKGADNYPNHRDCFSCHHQTLPLLAMREALAYGVAIDKRIFKEQTEFTRAFFEGRMDSVRKGEAVGGRAMTAAYALWTLEIAGQGRDPVPEALVSYLMRRQERNGRWKVQTHRPPLEQSNVMTTFLAVYTMERFASKKQRVPVSQAGERAKSWLFSQPLHSQEDRNAMLWALREFKGAGDDGLLLRGILDAQKSDGGWSQVDDMPSDAYATGQTLWILNETGVLPKDDPAMKRGVGYLLRTQEEDGSWLVRTRIKPIQRFFDNGDPHGKHQFISIAATGWAVAALAAIHQNADP